MTIVQQESENMTAPASVKLPQVSAKVSAVTKFAKLGSKDVEEQVAEVPNTTSTRGEGSLALLRPMRRPSKELKPTDVPKESSEGALALLRPVRRPSKQLKPSDVPVQVPTPPQRQRSASLPGTRGTTALIMHRFHGRRASCTDAAPSTEPRDVALHRFILSMAKRRHQERESYQARQEEVVPTVETSECSLWRLRQCKEILREAVQDVVAATKACSTASNCIQMLQKAVEETKEMKARSVRCTARMQRVKAKLHAARVLDQQLQGIRDSEAQWWELSHLPSLNTNHASVKMVECC